ncbi:MAG: hypothetical protein RBU21_01985 [FCB group bacterium]|jgi:hypothetical protein|nr:hypothetical protein [FCB group bacterium]
MHYPRHILLMLAVLSVLWAPDAPARMRVSYDDATVVDRSELIVVGHIKKGSVRDVAHAVPPGGGKSWHHTAVLCIAETIKGKTEKTEIPIIIHYGLDPRVGGYELRDGARHNRGGSRPGYPKELIEILDTGNSAFSGQPLVPDAAKDNLWFLRRREGTFGETRSNGPLGIVDPEDLQPLELKPYFACYLDKDPESTVARYAAAHPEVAKRAQAYLDHCEVQRILKIEDAEARARRLLPYFLKDYRWDGVPEALKGLEACGDPAGAVLMTVFDAEEYRSSRVPIIRIWESIRYKEAVPVLVKLLKEHDQFWAGQRLEAGWWNDDSDPELMRRRQEVSGETYYAVAALRHLGNPSAREAIELTLNRWRGIVVDTPQIVEECERALRTLDGQTAHN